MKAIKARGRSILVIPAFVIRRDEDIIYSRMMRLGGQIGQLIFWRLKITRVEFLAMPAFVDLTLKGCKDYNSH